MLKETPSAAVEVSEGIERGICMRNHFGSAVSALALTVALGGSAVAQGQQHSFDIPAQSASTGVRKFAQQAGIQVVIVASDADGRKTNSVQGNLGVRAALDKLLAQTGLSVRSFDGKIAILEAQPHAENDREPEEVVVTGIRASLDKSLEIKRGATGVVDAMVAKDISDFPDLNIAESLQRMTGVTISRVEGEGHEISVRGLAPQFTNVTINGFPIMSGEGGRDVDFDVFASELFSAVRLMKTPSADLTEGGMAATVDLKTARPFDYNGFTASASVQGTYTTLTDSTKPRVSALLSDTFLDGTLGALVSFAYSDREARLDSIEGFRWTSGTFNVNGTTYSNVDYAQQPRTRVEDHDRSKMGINAALQYKPSDEFQVNIDGLHARLSDNFTRYDLQQVMTTQPTALALTVVNNTVVAGTFKNILQQEENIAETVPETSDAIDAEAIWTPDAQWNLTVRGGWSRGEENLNELDIVYGTTSNTSYALSGPYAITSAAIDLTNSANFTENETIGVRTYTGNQSITGRADLTYRTDWAWLTSVEAGFQYADRAIVRNAFQTTFRPTGTVPVGSAAAAAFPYPNFLSGFNAPGALNNFVTANFAAAKANPQIVPVGFTAAANPLASFVVRESTPGGYVQANFDGDLWGIDLKADAGVRVVSTTQVSLGSQLVNTSYFPISSGQAYTDVLPSANVRLGLTDDLVLRLASSKAMTRPDLASLSPMESVAPITDRATVGNPTLAPYRLTQYDASLEWYFTKEGLLSAAIFRKDVASFIVNVTTLQVITGPDLIDGNGKNISGTLFNVTGPVNGTGGYVQGVELSYQQPFDFLPAPYDGFGVLANYTHADSNTNVAINGQNLNIPLPGQSANSYTLSGYYEKYGINFRVAYSWRDKYLIQVFTGSRLQMEAPYGQIDLSARYDLSDKWAVTFDALNLTDSKEYQFDNGPGKGPMAYIDYGQNFLLGLRAKL